MSSWVKKSKKFKRNMHEVSEKLFDDKTNWDVFFKVRTVDGITVDFRAHKLVMASTSDVFQAMLFGPTARAQKYILVEDVEPVGFHYLIKFAYGLELDVKSFDDAIATALCAKKYSVVELQDICLKYLCEYIDVDKVFAHYQSGIFFDSEKLEKKCIKLITDNFVKIEKCDENELSKTFLLLSAEHIKKLVEGVSSELNAASLFGFLVLWCYKQLERPSDETLYIRYFFEPFLPHIRFLTMSGKDFANRVANRGVLTLEEEAAIEVNIGCQGQLRRPLPNWCNHTCAIDNFFTVEAVAVDEEIAGTNPEVLLNRIRMFRSGETFARISTSEAAHLSRINFFVEEDACFSYTVQLEDKKGEFKEEFTMVPDDPTNDSQRIISLLPHGEVEINLLGNEFLLKGQNDYRLTVKFGAIRKTYSKMPRFYEPEKVQDFSFADSADPDDLYFTVFSNDCQQSTFSQLQFRVTSYKAATYEAAS